MKTLIIYKKRHRKRYKNKNLITRMKNKWRCGGIGKDIKLVFQMQIDVRVEKMPIRITSCFRMNRIE
jgi:mRNA-degrading endonuclease YafQ of YafQ-DinJ toxin-antitoxin module